MIEHETKVLPINVKEIDEKLLALGAEKKGTHLMRRWVFDWKDDPGNIHEWIRLRDDGHQVTITLKKKYDDHASETTETEIVVDNFEKAATILKTIPFKVQFYQENRRTLYIYEDIEFSIDEWPGLEPHLEIEGKTKEAMEKGVQLLGVQDKAIGDVSATKLYREIGIELHTIPELTFDLFNKINK